MAAKLFTKQFGGEAKGKRALLPCITINTRAKVTACVTINTRAKVAAKYYIFGSGSCEKQGIIVVFILRRGFKNILHEVSKKKKIYYTLHIISSRLVNLKFRM